MATDDRTGRRSRLWSSGAALVLAVSLVSSARVDVRTYQRGGLLIDYTAGLAALRYAEPVPEWLDLPELSSRPSVTRIGAAGSTALHVSYRTITSTASVLAHHRAAMAWKGLDWLTFPQRPGQPFLVIGIVPSSGERVVITVRSDGPLQSVDVVHSEPARPRTAALTY